MRRTQGIVFSARALRRWRRAFTLIEVLVVIAVIALLIGLMVPAFAGARDAGRGVVCSSDLRQWAMGANEYTAENKGYLPRRGQGANPTTTIDRDSDWFNALPPMLGESRYVDLASQGLVPRPGSRTVWMCPSAVETGTDNFFAFGMNMRLSVQSAPDPDRIDSVALAHLQVFMADAPGPQCSVLPAAQPYSPLARYRGSVNIAFLDTHTNGYPGSSVGCGIGDPLRSDVVWLVPGSSWNPPP